MDGFNTYKGLISEYSIEALPPLSVESMDFAPESISPQLLFDLEGSLEYVEMHQPSRLLGSYNAMSYEQVIGKSLNHILDTTISGPTKTISKRSVRKPRCSLAESKNNAQNLRQKIIDIKNGLENPGDFSRNYVITQLLKSKGANSMPCEAKSLIELYGVSKLGIGIILDGFGISLSDSRKKICGDLSSDIQNLKGLLKGSDFNRKNVIARLLHDKGDYTSKPIVISLCIFYGISEPTITKILNRFGLRSGRKR